jgi:hypothetical protein
MIKRTFYLFAFVAVLIFSNLIAVAQNSDWLWARKAGSAGIEEGVSIASDNEGSVVIAGNFNGAAITFGNSTLINAGGYDLFIVKYSNGGDVVWAQSAGGPLDEKSESIALDPSGNVYMTGTFSSPQVSFGNITLNNSDSTDIFTVKYDSSGNVLWAKRAVGNRQDYSQCMSVDGNGNAYLAGYFNSSSISFSNHTIANSHTGFYDIFLVRYDVDGNVDWVKSANGYFSDRASSVSCDDNGNVFLAGYFYSSTMFFDTDTIFNAGKYNFFLSRYDTEGNLTWAVSGGGTEDDRVQATTVDKDGNVYVAGTFTSPALSLGNYTLINADSSDIFLAKYNAAGNVVWAERAGGADQDAAAGITTGKNGNTVYITGYFKSSSINFGDNILNNTSPGYADIFIAGYDLSGKVLLALKADGVSSDYSESITTDNTGNLYITGSFFSSPLAFGNYSLNRTGQNDMFISKYGPLTNGLWDGEEVLSASVYPNPSKNSVHILYNLAAKAHVNIKVYDITGKEQALICDELQLQGQHEVIFNGLSLPKGIYLYRIISGDRLASGKIILSEE